jgi:hypothetical protein
MSNRMATSNNKRTQRIMKQQIIPKLTQKDYRPVFEVGETNAVEWPQSRVQSTSPRTDAISHRNANASPKSHQPGRPTMDINVKSSHTPLGDRNSRMQHSLTKSHVSSQAQALSLTTQSMGPKGTMPLAYRSINKFNQTARSNTSRVVETASHPKDPELVCTEKVLPETIEEEIKDGFFELKQKFKETGPSSIYISHVVLHEKHPILKKVEVETLKQLLLESSVIYLSVG